MPRHATPRTTRTRVIVGAVLVLLAWLALAGVGGPAAGKLSQLQRNDNGSFLPADAESTVVAETIKQFSDTATLPLIVVAERPEGLTPTDLTLAGRFASQLPQRPLGAEPSRTLASLLTAPTLTPIPSKDGKAFLVIVPLDAEQSGRTIGAATGLSVAADTVKAAMESQLRAEGLTAYVTGPGGFVADLVTAFSGIDGILLFIAMAVVLLILLVVYRSPVLPFAVLLTAVFGLSAAALVVYLVAKAGWITVTGQSQGILSILVVGAATDYSLLLVSRYKEELHDRESTWEALRVAWKATVEPIVASAATVILGLLALTLAELKGTAGLGPVGALGIVGALFSALTFLPAVLVLGRRWIFWPSVPRVDHVHRADVISAKLGWGAVARLVGARPRATWVVTGLILLGFAAFTPSLKAEGIAAQDTFLVKVDSVVGQQVLARHFDAGSGSPVQIVVPADKATRVVEALGTEAGVVGPFVGTAPGAPTRVVEGRVLVQATLTDPADAPAAADTVRRLRTDLDVVGTDVLVGGQTAQTLDVRLSADRDLRVVVPAIIGVVFLVLALLLRSLVAPLLLVAANVLSFGATMGASALVFNHVFRFPGGDPTTVLYGFVFLVALGVDYSIFLMTRAREETRALGPKQGVLTALAVTGGVITSAGLVLAATFGALAVLPLLFLAQIAFIVAFGVLLDTLVVRSLLVPAVTVELGARTWWPSTLSRTSRTGEPAPSSVSRVV